MGYASILAASDFSRASEPALRLAVRMARSSGSRLTVVHVCEVPTYLYAEPSVTPVELLAPIIEVARRRLADLVASLQADCPGTKGMFRVGVPWEQVLAAAEETGAELVVLGTHGRRGVSHALMGSVAERVVRTAPVPVLTVRGAAPGAAPEAHRGAFHRVLIATDFGEDSDRAVASALDLAGAEGLAPTFVHVCELPAYVHSAIAFSPDLMQPVLDWARERMEALLASVRARFPGAEGVIELGDPRDRILAVASRTGADLVVVGTRGTGGLARLVLGSCAEAIVRTSPVPVLSVRAPTSGR